MSDGVLRSVRVLWGASYFSNQCDRRSQGKTVLTVITAPGCGQSWPQECPAAGHIVPIVSKQRETKAGTQFSSSFFFFLFYYIWDPCPSDDVTHIQWGFSFQWDYSLEMYSQAHLLGVSPG